MKNKSIINICKKENIMMICSSADKQRWISCGAAIYQFIGLQDISYDELCYIYDIDDAKKEKMILQMTDMPTSYDFADVTGDEFSAKPMKICLQCDGRMLQPYTTALGVLYLDLQYLAPFNLKDRSNMFVFVRVTKNGTPYFVIKIGLLIQAIIMPVKISKEDKMFDELNQILKTTYIISEGKQ